MREANDFQNTDVVIRNLKAAIYDAISIVTENISALEEKLEKATDEEKLSINQKLEIQREKFDNTVKISNELIENVEDIDSYKKVKEVIKQSDNSPILLNSNSEDKIDSNKFDDASPIDETKDFETIYKEELNTSKDKLDTEKPEIKQNENIPEEEKKEGLNKKRKFQKKTKKVTKAIIVSKKQLERLIKSRINQEQLLLEKKIIGETDGFGTFKSSIDNQMTKEETFLNQNSNIAAKQYDDPEREIEDLTVKAKILYEANEKEEAEKINNRIRELTKVISDNNQTKE